MTPEEEREQLEAINKDELAMFLLKCGAILAGFIYVLIQLILLPFRLIRNLFSWR